MLSFDPDKPFAGVNFGLDNAFAAQQNQAQQALEMTDEQFKNLMAAQDQTNNLAAQRTAANAAGNVPQLRFGGESLAEGLGYGINNFYAMKGYGQQQQAHKDIIAQQQAAQRNKAELVNRYVTGQQREIDTQNQQIPALLQGATPQEITAYQAANKASGGKLFVELSTRFGQGRTDAVLAPIKGTADGQAQVNKGTAINTGVAQMGPVEKNGIPIPSAVDNVRQIRGTAPTTTADINEKVLGNQQAAANLQKTSNELSVQPVQLQQEVELKKLQIAKAQVDAQFAEQETQLKIKREQLAHKQGTLDYQKGLEEYKRFQQGQQLYKQLQDSGALDSNDPAKQAQAQAQLGIYGIKYNPPSSSFQTVKRKDGTIYMLDKNTGQLGKLEKDGTVKTWQDLQL